MNGRKTYEAPTLEDLGDLGSFIRANAVPFSGNDGVVIEGKFLNFSL